MRLSGERTWWKRKGWGETLAPFIDSSRHWGRCVVTPTWKPGEKPVWVRQWLTESPSNVGMGYDVIEGMMSLKGPFYRRRMEEIKDCSVPRRKGKGRKQKRWERVRNVCVQSLPLLHSLIPLTSHPNEQGAGLHLPYTLLTQELFSVTTLVTLKIYRWLNLKSVYPCKMCSVSIK